MTPSNDEISLRELYLIGRRGLPAVLVVTVVAAVLTYLLAGLTPTRYRADAVVQVTPLQVSRTLSDAVDLSAVTGVSFDTYRTIALGSAVLAATHQAVPDLEVDAASLSDRLSLERVAGDANGPIVVAHWAEAGTAAGAAALANAWAAAASNAERSTVTESLQELAANLDGQTQQLAAALQGAEAAWQTFQAKDDRDQLNAQLEGLAERRTTAEQRLDFLTRLEAASTARQRLLSGVVRAREQGDPAAVTDQLEALRSSGALPPDLSDALATALSALPAAGVPASQDLATLVARVQLQNETANVAAYVAEGDTIASQVGGLDRQAADLRTRVASLEAEAADLTRQLDGAQAAYDQISNLSPALAVARNLADGSARVLTQASAPERPVATRRNLLTVAVAVVAFLVMIVLVYLRAAIVLPEPAEAR